MIFYFSCTSGSGESGQLGHGNSIDISTFMKVEGLEDHCISQVTCGDEFTTVLTTEGAVYTFGGNQFGQTGHGIIGGNRSTPKIVTGCLESKKVVYVASNYDHSACIMEDGEIYTWGNGSNGRLGHGNQTHRSTPKRVEGLAGKKAKHVACGGYHTLVCTEDGRVYSFGRGSYGQLGHGNCEGKLIPTLIQQVPLESKSITQVACGYSHSLVLTSEGCVHSFGSGNDKQLGHDGSIASTTFPFVVESLMMHRIVHIASRNVHSVALAVSKCSSYANKMKAMIDDETCSDVVFVLKDGERIHANKGILIGQSEYFRAMFRSGMRESKKNEIEIGGDCSKKVFLLFLENFYKGTVQVGMDDALDLLKLSDRYQEDDLISQCLKVIEAGLSGTNAIELLVEADGSGLVTLKEVCMQYVVRNSRMCLTKDRIEILSPSLTAELLYFLGKVNQS